MLRFHERNLAAGTPDNASNTILFASITAFTRADRSSSGFVRFCTAGCQINQDEPYEPEALEAPKMIT
ncbi:hypothetical protein K439DRAFT_1629894 [Ramaria rubella]|nr:hypothetical protein K439DRAFT_1629894 [Ramaria rubella]